MGIITVHQHLDARLSDDGRGDGIDIHKQDLQAAQRKTERNQMQHHVAHTTVPSKPCIAENFTTFV